jgi:hypothetical protein
MSEKTIKINTCDECPHYDYYNVIGGYGCLKMKKRMEHHASTIDLDCPLDDCKNESDKLTAISDYKKDFKTINEIIYAAGLLLGSDEYFKVRAICLKHCQDLM